MVSGFELVEDLIGHFEVGEDVDGVLVVVEQVVEFDDLAGDGGVVDHRGVLRDRDQSFRGDREA